MVDVEQTDGDPWVAYRESRDDSGIAPSESLGEQSGHGKYSENPAWHMDIGEVGGEYEELTRKEIYKRRIDKSKSRLKQAGQ